jgi:hypothetical protein
MTEDEQALLKGGFSQLADRTGADLQAVGDEIREAKQQVSAIANGKG